MSENSVELFRKRRYRRLMSRLRLDEDEGEWRTTESGHKILIKDGAVVGGSVFAVAKMGAPEKAQIPKKSVDIKVRNPYKGLSMDDMKSLGETLSNRADKDCAFGGFYLVKRDRGVELEIGTFFNPYTGEHFDEVLDDRENDLGVNPVGKALKDMNVNKDALWLWNRSNDVVQQGDTVQVMKGRTLPHGMESTVKFIRDYTNDYGSVVATYAYLDNGEKINVDNLGIVEDGKVKDKGETLVKVPGKNGRTRTIRVTKQDKENINYSIEKATKSAEKGDRNSTFALIRNLPSYVTIEVESDGEKEEITLDKAKKQDELTDKIVGKKNIKIRAKW